MPRTSGILLHPTSLPGPYGIGDLGTAAYDFIRFLVSAHQTYWQVLPLGPTGYGDSPYQTFSAFAGNPLLISVDSLIADGWIAAEDATPLTGFAPHTIDFGPLIDAKQRLLRRAAVGFAAHASTEQRAALAAFVTTQSAWLSDFALFMALKDAHEGAPWPQWPADLVARQPHALAEWRARLADSISAHTFAQYVFFQQWEALKSYANQRGVRIVGDAPIFVAHDSADCWANPHLFSLDANGQPISVAGVPPDYFSATGQLWGNPLYRWDVLASTGYRWWADRLRAAFTLVDVLRIDHFRGFAGYWAIPASAPTAETGEWLPGPGLAFFTEMRQQLGTLPIIAEDLGVITPDVEEMRDKSGFPGMHILQFAFSSDAGNEHLPHRYRTACVAYTGTHDNDTTAGWLASAGASERAYALDYMDMAAQSTTHATVWGIIRLAMASVADTAIVPLQDLLVLGTEARMNMPGRLGGNWSWRYAAPDLTDELGHRLARVVALYGRTPA